MIRALPLWQPWASLIAIGAKRIETRPKAAPRTILGQRIVIHACLTQGNLWQVATSPFAEHLMQAVEDGTLAEVDGHLPLGHLLCTAVVSESRAITRAFADELRETNPDEFAFGDYRTPIGPKGPHRFAWMLEDVQRLPEPVAFKGSQGIFFVAPEMVGLPVEREPAETQGTLL